MLKLDKFFFQEIGKKIYIDVDSTFIKNLEKEFENIINRLEELKKIDVTNVEPLTRISPPISFLRSDEIDLEIKLNKQTALENAKEKNEEFIIVKRTLK